MRGKQIHDNVKKFKFKIQDGKKGTLVMSCRTVTLCLAGFLRSLKIK
jgi:hypothetical protein